MQLNERPKPSEAPIEWLTEQRGCWDGYNGIRDGRYEPTATEINRRDEVAV